MAREVGFSQRSSLGDLEERISSVEVENKLLRRELEQLKARLESDDVKECGKDEEENSFARTAHNDSSKQLPIPEFGDHIVQPDEFLRWLKKVERLFELHETSDEIRANLVANSLGGYAAIWWKWVQKTRERRGKSKIQSWEKMKQRMRKHFVPPDYVAKQGYGSVKDYTEEFYYLLDVNDTEETEERLIMRFIEGLEWRTRNDVEKSHPRRLVEAVQLASQLEAAQLPGDCT